MWLCHPSNFAIPWSHGCFVAGLWWTLARPEKLQKSRSGRKDRQRCREKNTLFFKTGIELDPSARLVFLFGIGDDHSVGVCFNEEFFSTSTDILYTLAKFSSFFDLTTRLDASF